MIEDETNLYGKKIVGGSLSQLANLMKISEVKGDKMIHCNRIL